MHDFKIFIRVRLNSKELIPYLINKDLRASKRRLTAARVPPRVVLAVLTVCTLCITLTFVIILMKFIVFNLQSYWCWKKLEPPWHIETRMWKTDRKDNMICSDVPWVTHGLFNAVESAACCWVIKRIKLWQISYTYICQMWWCSSRSWS